MTVDHGIWPQKGKSRPLSNAPAHYPSEASTDGFAKTPHIEVSISLHIPMKLIVVTLERIVDVDTNQIINASITQQQQLSGVASCTDLSPRSLPDHQLQGVLHFLSCQRADFHK